MSYGKVKLIAFFRRVEHARKPATIEKFDRPSSWNPTWTQTIWVGNWHVGKCTPIAWYYLQRRQNKISRTDSDAHVSSRISSKVVLRNNLSTSPVVRSGKLTRHRQAYGWWFRSRLCRSDGHPFSVRVRSLIHTGMHDYSLTHAASPGDQWNTWCCQAI